MSDSDENGDGKGAGVGMCPGCGEPLPSRNVIGLCPKCMLEGAETCSVGLDSELENAPTVCGDQAVGGYAGGPRGTCGRPGAGGELHPLHPALWPIKNPTIPYNLPKNANDRSLS